MLVGRLETVARLEIVCEQCPKLNASTCDKALRQALAFCETLCCNALKL